MKPMPRPTPLRRNVAAFTLIELLTVIAIIGILAAIISPTVGKVRQTAVRAKATSNLRACHAMHMLHANDNKDQIAPYQSSALASKYGFSPFRWMHILTVAGYAGTVQDPKLVNAFEVFGNPGMISYYQNKGYNLKSANTWARNGNIGPDVDGSTNGRVVTLAQLEAPNRTLLLTEGAIQASNEWFNNEVWTVGWQNRLPPPADFQDGKAFVAYADGHVELMPGTTLKDRWDNQKLFSHGRSN